MINRNTKVQNKHKSPSFTKATWLPFKPMKEMQGTMFKTTEAIWSNHKTNYDAVQQSLQF